MVDRASREGGVGLATSLSACITEIKGPPWNRHTRSVNENTECRRKRAYIVCVTLCLPDGVVDMEIGMGSIQGRLTLFRRTSAIFSSDAIHKASIEETRE